MPTRTNILIITLFSRKLHFLSYRTVFWDDCHLVGSLIRSAMRADIMTSGGTTEIDSCQESIKCALTQGCALENVLNTFLARFLLTLLQSV